MTSPTRRVCVVMPVHWSYALGGAEMQAEMLVRRMVESGRFDVHVVCRAVDPGFQPIGYTLHTIQAKRSIAGTFPLDLLALSRVLDSIRPDVVYQRVGCAYTAAAAWYCRRHAKKMLWHISSDNDVAETPWRPDLRSPFEKLDRALINYGARRADTLVVQSQGQADAVTRKFGRKDPVRIRNFHPTAGPQPSKPKGTVSVCWVANLKPLKQPEVFLRLAETFAHRSDVEFNIAGANQMTATEWRELESRMSKVPNLRYLGHISNDAVNALLTRSHVLVNTSRYEGFPNTFIQAWLRKVPVISLSVNPDQLLDTADFGWCANGSLDALYAALRRAIDDPALRETVGARAQCAADALFSVKNIDSLIELLYAE